MKNLGFINDNKSIITKEYGDKTYASQNEISSLTDKVGDVEDALGGKSDTSHTHNNTSFGQGYCECTTDASATEKVVTLSEYELVKDGIVCVKFTNAVPASATLNINSKGAKEIYHKGSAITTNVIGAGDTGTFIYDGSRYHLIAVDYRKSYVDGNTLVL